MPSHRKSLLRSLGVGRRRRKRRQQKNSPDYFFSICGESEMAATGRQQPKKRFVLLIDQPKKKGGGNRRRRRRRRQRCRLLPVPIRRHSRGESTPTHTHTLRIFCVRIAVKVTRAGKQKKARGTEWHFASSSFFFCMRVWPKKGPPFLLLYVGNWFQF